MASPNVKLDGGVFSSLRMIQLGTALGTSVYDAVGRMALLWQYCTERQVSTLPETLIAGVVDPKLIVEAHLGERVDGGIRLKGTEGRIEWFGKLQESGKKGAARRWKGRLKGRHKVAIGSPQTPDSQSVGVGVVTDVGVSSSGKRGRGGKGETHLPSDWKPTEQHAERAAKSGIDLAEQADRFRLHAETNGRTAVSWNAAFTTWLMNAPSHQRGLAQRAGTAPIRDRAAEIWAMAEAEQENE